mmetsp:Transcript_26409/g.34357  ORF Transcript_26409/g.34357 Transcript_26409/m.34357 type:complete len:110 (+) Transcript_26409:287-616(+)
MMMILLKTQTQKMKMKKKKKKKKLKKKVVKKNVGGNQGKLIKEYYDKPKPLGKYSQQDPSKLALEKEVDALINNARPSAAEIAELHRLHYLENQRHNRIRERGGVGSWK